MPKTPKPIPVDRKALCSIDHECVGCVDVAKTCCARYDVTVSEARLNKIIPYLPQAAEYCPHLKTEEGYANVFEEAEEGLHSIDTHENNLCVFAFTDKKGLIRCSLHAVEKDLSLPLGTIKPEVCILWPLTFSEKGALTLHEDALGCACSSPRKVPSDVISPDLLATVRHFGGEMSRRSTT